MKNKSLNLILLSSFTLFLTACGGGGESSNNEQPTVTNTPTASIQPRAINTENWQSARLIQSENPMQNSIEIVGSELNINIVSNDISKGAHLQIYINSDNKPETGFQFENEAWEESGVDYLIEDGDLFKSTENNTGWNWNVNIGAIDYTVNTDSASAMIDLSLLGDICNNIKVGVMTRDEHWDISTFSPASSQMQTYNVAYCNTEVADTVNPEISLLGANPINLTIGDVFTDPGATATDNIDGDITNRIETKSTVDTATAGIYEVTYLVTDLTGNSANISRVVNISEIPTPEGIVIDGNSNDWSGIPALSSSADAIMKVSDDEEKIYILVTSSNLGDNIQVLMDTDNNAATGLELSAQVNAWLAGADYMVENNSLDKSKSNTGWSWDYGIAPIEYIKTVDTLEIAIKKSDFNNLANNIPIGYVSRTAEWNANYTLPVASLPVYTLKVPVAVNPVIANNDSVTTPNNLPIKIDVLANDFSQDTSELTITQVNLEQSGTAVIEQGKIKYTPDPTYTGTVTFTYQISNSNGNRDSASIKVIVTAPTINNPPIAVNDSYIIDIATQSSVLLDVLANDSDPDGDTLTLINVVDAPGGAYSISTDNKVLFVPSPRINVIPEIPYTISDGNGGITTGRFTVNIIDSTNTNPVANDDSITTIQNQSVTFNALENDTDADGDIITSGGIGTGANFNGSVVSNPNGSFTYTPNQDFIGIDTFTYSISDNRTGSASGTVKITVNAPTPNIPPIAKNDFVTTDGIKTLRIFVENNDSDPDGGGAGVELNNDFTQPANGTVSRNTPHTLDYTPNPTFSGIDTFTYSITDIRGATASATVTVTVPENNAPDAVEDSTSVFFDQTITIDVLSNDTDPDNDVLSVQSIVQPTVGVAVLNPNGSIFFDPQNTIGSISIGYTVSDGRGGTDFAILTVASSDPNDGNNAYPDITNEQVTTPKNTAIFIDVLANDSDADGDVLVLDQVDQGQNGTTIKINGGVRYTPNSGFVGTDFFYYGVHDGHGHNGAGVVEITVTQ